MAEPFKVVSIDLKKCVLIDITVIGTCDNVMRIAKEFEGCPVKVFVHNEAIKVCPTYKEVTSDGR